MNIAGRSWKVALFSALLAVAASGCKAKLEGALLLNGTPFQPTACRSGETYGFVGVELTNAEGASLRFVQTPTNVPQVLYFASEGAPAMVVGVCGAMSVRRTNTRINNVYNVEGTVTPQCMGPMTVSGSLNFANCH
jgi:hypothetical protein